MDIIIVHTKQFWQFSVNKGNVYKASPPKNEYHSSNNELDKYGAVDEFINIRI